MTDTRRLAVALVRGLHGLNGLVRVEVLTDQPEARFALGRELFVEGTRRPLVVRIGAPVEDGPGWWLAFERHADRPSVEPLRGRYLEADVSLADVRANGAVLWDEVIGLSVHDLDGRDLGRVVEVYRAGGAEVYIVRGGPLGDFDLPSVRDVIRTFDPPGGHLVIDVAALGLDVPSRNPPAVPRRRPRWSRHGAGQRAITPPEDEG